MIPRLPIAGTACLAFLSGFEQILCFAAAAPAPRIEARPKHYFPRHVKRIVTNTTQSQSQSQSSTTDLETEQSSLQSEKSTHTPTSTLDHTSSQSLSGPLESLLTSLLPAAFAGGLPFIRSPSVSSASPSSANTLSRASSSVDPHLLSLSITPPGIIASSNKPSSTQPLSSSVLSPSTAPGSTASTLLSSLGLAGLQDVAASLSAGVAPKSSGTPSSFLEPEASLSQTLSSRSSSQSFAEPASTSNVPASSQTLSSPKTDATELSASVTAPPKTISTSPGTPSSGQSRSGEFSLSKSTATDQIVNGFVDQADNEVNALGTDQVEDDIISQPRPVTSSRSGSATRSATESTRSGPSFAIPTTSLTPSVRPSNSSAESALRSDKTALDIGIPESATEISFALFGANTVVFSTSTPTISSSENSLQTSITKSGGADITASESIPRNTNTPESSEGVQSTFNGFKSAGVQTTPAHSSAAPEKTLGFEGISVEPERSASITRPVNGSVAGIFPGDDNTGKRPDGPDRPDRPGRPDIELPGLDDLVTLASSIISTPQRSSSEFSGSGTISAQATASVGGSTAEETRAVKRSSEFLFGSGGSFTVGGTAPITALLPRPTITASVSQPGDVASDLIGESALPTISKSKGLDESLSSDIVAARPTITIPSSIEESALPTISKSKGLDEDISSDIVVARPMITIPSSIEEIPLPTVSKSKGLDEDLSSDIVVARPTITIPDSIDKSTLPIISKSAALDESLSSDIVAARPTITTSDGLVLPIPVITLGQAKPSISAVPKPDLSGSALVDSDSSTRPVDPEKSITAASSGSLTSEPNIPAPSSLKTSVSVSQNISEQSNTPTATLSDQPKSTLSDSEPAKTSKSGPDAIPQESNKPGTELPEGTTASLSTIGSGSSKTSNIDAPQATEPSASKSNELPSASPGSVINSEKESATGAPNGASATGQSETKTLLTEAVPKPTNSIPEASTLTADKDGSPTASSPLSVKPSLTAQTDSIPQASASTTDRVAPPIPPTSAVEISPSIKPSPASQSDANAEKPSETLSLTSSIARSQPPISVPLATDLSQSAVPSILTQTDSSIPKETQQSGSPQTVVPGSTDVSLSTEASRAAQTATATVKAPQTNSEPIATDLPPLTETSRGIQTGSPADKTSLSSVPLITDIPSSVPLPSATDISPPKETSRSAQTNLVSEKPALPSDLPGSLSIPAPSATGSSPPTEPSPASLSSAPPPASVPVSRTEDANPPTTGIPVVTSGPATSKATPAEPSKPIAASDNQATYDKLTATSSAGSQTGQPVVIPVSASPSVSSSGYVAPPPSSGTSEVVSITASPAVSLSTEEAAKPITNLPSAVPAQPSESSIASSPIPIGQNTFTAPVTSKDSGIPASTGSAPVVIVLPSPTLSSQISGSAASAPTGGQPSATATPGDASVTLGASSPPTFLVGISNVLTASTSNSGGSGYSSRPGPSSTTAGLSNGVTVAEPSGVSPSAGGVPTGVLSGPASATAAESISSTSAATASLSIEPGKAEGSGASVSPAVPATSAIQTSSGYLSSGAVSGLPSIETSKPAVGSEATGSLTVATPALATAQSTEASSGLTTPGAQPNLVPSTGATGLNSGPATETGASTLPSSVPADLGSLKPGSTTNVLPPSATASLPSTITPVKEGPKSEWIVQSGSNMASPTGTDTLTAQLIGSSILAEPSASMPTATADFPTGIPSSVPRIISPPNGVPETPDNTTLCQIGFLYPLNYKFVLEHEQSQRQIFKYLPQGIADGLSIPLENVTMQTLRAYDTTQDLHYITTLALFFIPSQQMDLLSLDLHSPAHKIYNNTNPSVKTIMSMINPAIPLKGDNNLNTPSAPGSGDDDSTTSSSPDPGNEGVPINEVNNSSPVRAKSVGIAAGVVCGAAAYGAAMFFVARRYRKRKQSHRRSPSMLSSPVLSGTSHDYTVGAGTALMSGGRGDGDRSLTPHNGYYYERNSRGSGHSGSTGRQQISAPVMAENSLGWN